MCGIVGLSGEGARDPALIARMSGRLAHRGPDDEGLWSDADAGVAFGHRRLAIVDLSDAGHEPMHSASGRLVVTFNGEIYNHPEIRAELEARGQAPEGGWRGHSDIETLLQAIECWGLQKALDAAAGMFAFALWDRRSRRLSLVRDRFGEKPLYYGWAGRDFLFGSELKALRTHPAFDAEIARSAVGLFASRGYIPAPLSIFASAFKLLPGCVLDLDGSGPVARHANALAPGEQVEGIRCWRYWSYRDALRAGLADPIATEGEAIDALEAAIAQAVSGQSMADVPVGAFLSGGIDSSTVVAAYQQHSTQPVRTFTIGFEEQGYNEADDARAVARHFRTEHHERVVTAAEAQQVIPRLPEIYDEPFADASQIPTFLVSAFAREQVKVALSGDGGDELFGGYNRYFGTARLWAAARHVPRPLRVAGGGALGLVPAAVWDGAGKIAGQGRLPPHFGSKVRKSLRAAGSARGLEDLFAGFLDDWAGDAAPVRGLHNRHSAPFDLDLGPGAPDQARMMYADALSYLPDDVLCKVDRASMAVSLETRAPFLDHRLAAVAARIPISMKIRGGSGKRVLKKVLARHAPPSLFDRPKAGFSVPVGEWIKGPLRPWAEDLLDPAAMRADGWFDADVISRRWKDHLSGRRDSASALWSIMMFQAWLRQQEAAPSVAAAA